MLNDILMHNGDAESLKMSMSVKMSTENNAIEEV